MLEFHATGFHDLLTVNFTRFEDHRGILVKPWVEPDLIKIFGRNMETYISSSSAGTIRGLHYQKGPLAQKKFTLCLNGKIESIAVDLRRDSVTYGKVFSITLDALDGKGVIVPEGFACGVYAHEDSMFISFNSQVHSIDNERGILWSSVPGLKDLPVTNVSQKDSQLPALDEVML